MITNPTPQRSLRGHRPSRPTPRAATSNEHVARLAARLTPRDRWLARMLLEHRVLTSTQIAAMAWPSLRAANLRLRELYLWRVVDRFQPYVTSGTAPMHYVLDAAGAHLLAHEEGVDVRDLGFRHERAVGIAHSLRLAHTTGTNSFFAALIARTRREPAGAGGLTTWWSEGRCARHFGDIVRPDAYGRWYEDGEGVEWFLEYDAGTERPDRVGAKIPDYARLATATGIVTPVLIWLPTARRESAVRRALTSAVAALDEPGLVPIATASADRLRPGDDPSGLHWQPLGTGSRLLDRLSLDRLGSSWPGLSPLRDFPATVAGDPGGRLAPSPIPPRASRRRPRR